MMFPLQLIVLFKITLFNKNRLGRVRTTDSSSLDRPAGQTWRLTTDQMFWIVFLARDLLRQYAARAKQFPNILAATSSFYGCLKPADCAGEHHGAAHSLTFISSPIHKQVILSIQ